MTAPIPPRKRIQLHLTVAGQLRGLRNMGSLALGPMNGDPITKCRL
jgi:hypothetical protein